LRTKQGLNSMWAVVHRGRMRKSPKTVWWDRSVQRLEIGLTSCWCWWLQVPGGEKKRCSSIFDRTAPQLPASSSKHRRNKQEPATCGTTDTKRLSRTITCQWHPVRGALLAAQSAVAAAPPSQLRRIRSQLDGNARAIMPPRGARGSLAHSSVSHSLLALPCHRYHRWQDTPQWGKRAFLGAGVSAK